MSIYIFSRPIHSGKTSELLQWCNLQENMHGILMPDIAGRRKIFNIHTKEIYDIECTDPTAATEPLTSVGRFHFYSAAFEKANSIILDALARDPAWLVIDEAGKLELEGKGFHEALKKATAFYSDSKTSGNLLITVRESLCEAVISFFEIMNYRVIHNLEEL